jgi:hypothetical protein
MRFGFGCFGFFASRLDRRFAVAIVGPFCPGSVRKHRTTARDPTGHAGAYCGLSPVQSGTE